MKKVHFIINPAAGADEPILSIINEVLTDLKLEWEVSVSRKPGEVYDLARKSRDKADIIAVYGGDGSVVDAARALHLHRTALAIIPGGTANVMAKELRLPPQSADAVRLLADGKYTIRTIDMGLLNGEPFLLRVNMGLMADMVTEASDEMKERYGQWAYGLAAFQNKDREALAFELVVDGMPISLEGVALTITNAGNVGKTGFSFYKNISVSDGYLDIILLDKADIASLLEVTGSILLKRDPAALQHWQAREVDVRLGQETPYLRDDFAGSGRNLHIVVSPGSLNVVIPS